MIEIPIVTISFCLTEIPHVIPLLYEKCTEDVKEYLADKHGHHLLEYAFEFKIMVSVQ